MTPSSKSARSLQTILFTDIVGSTERAAELGDQRWEDLLRSHHGVVREHLSAYGGREVTTAGDGFLAIFDKTGDGLLCAAAIRDAVGELGLAIRAGLHLGGVVIGEDDVSGIGVHIGARVAALAGPDEIYVSGTLRDVESGSDFAFEDRGGHQLKGVEGEWRIYALVGVPEADVPAPPAPGDRGEPTPTRPGKRSRLAVLFFPTVVAAAVFGWWVLRGPDAVPAGTPIRSLAVLPLANLSQDPEEGSFVDGLHDVLIGELSRLDSLTVISRTSVLRYRNPTQGMTEIAGELGVDAVVEGSVFRAGDSVRVQVQLIRGSPEEHLWSQAYDGAVREAMALQTRVARAIAEEIEIVLTPQVDARFAAAGHVDPAAQEAYYRGRALWRTRTRDGLRQAVPLLEEAVRIDPSFALGWVGLADAYTQGKAYGALDLTAKEVVERATAANHRALEINPDLAEAHASLGQTRLFFSWDIQGSEESLRRAIRLNRSYAMAYNWLAEVFSASDRLDEALDAWRAGHDLDPFSPLLNRNVARGYVWLDQCDRALEYVNVAEEIDPEILLVGDTRFICYTLGGRYEEAVEAFVHEWRLRAMLEESLEGIVQAFEVDGWEAMLRRTSVVMREMDQPYQAARAHAMLGEFDRAFELLEVVMNERSAFVIYLFGDPMLDRLREDPRWDEFVKRAGLIP